MLDIVNSADMRFFVAHGSDQLLLAMTCQSLQDMIDLGCDASIDESEEGRLKKISAQWLKNASGADLQTLCSLVPGMTLGSLCQTIDCDPEGLLGILRKSISASEDLGISIPVGISECSECGIDIPQA